MTAGDWTDDPAVQEWFGHVRAELVPLMRDSRVILSLFPEDGVPDPKYAVELGYSICLAKPIILLVPPGTFVPDKLVGVADAIVEGDITDPTTAKRMAEAIESVGGNGD